MSSLWVPWATSRPSSSTRISPASTMVDIAFGHHQHRGRASSGSMASRSRASVP